MIFPVESGCDWAQNVRVMLIQAQTADLGLAAAIVCDYTRMQGLGACKITLASAGVMTWFVHIYNKV